MCVGVYERMKPKGHGMKVLSVVSQKGGVGKTTLATALAVEASREGKQIVMFDLDPQASASFWKDTRKDETPRHSPKTLLTRQPSTPILCWFQHVPPFLT